MSQLQASALPWKEPGRAAALLQELSGRILVIDGAMGTMIQQHGLDEAGYRGARFAQRSPEVHLAEGEHRVEDRAGVVDGDHAVEADVARLEVDLDDGDVRTDREGRAHALEVRLAAQNAALVGSLRRTAAPLTCRLLAGAPDAGDVACDLRPAHCRGATRAGRLRAGA